MVGRSGGRAVVVEAKWPLWDDDGGRPDISEMFSFGLLGLAWGGAEGGRRPGVSWIFGCGLLGFVWGCAQAAKQIAPQRLCCHSRTRQCWHSPQRLCSR